MAKKKPTSKSIRQGQTVKENDSILWTIKIYDTRPPDHIISRIEDKPVEQHVIRNDNPNHFVFKVKSEKLTMVWIEVTRVSRSMKVVSIMVCVEDDEDRAIKKVPLIGSILMSSLEHYKDDIVNMDFIN